MRKTMTGVGNVPPIYLMNRFIWLQIEHLEKQNLDRSDLNVPNRLITKSNNSPRFNALAFKSQS